MPTKTDDVELCARAHFETVKCAVPELADAEWDQLPDSDSEGNAHGPEYRDYHRQEVQLVVETLWRAGRLRSEDQWQEDKWQ